MFKKISVVLLIVICLFTFAACGTDTKALEERIAQLEQELDEVKSAGGIKGDKGDKGDPGPQGPQGDMAGATRIYNLGETFTYKSAGIELFSITVEEYPNNPAFMWVTVKNICMPNCAPSDFVRARINIAPYSDPPSYASHSFSTTKLAIGSEYSEMVIHGKQPMYFGFPIATNSIMPYVVFSVV